MRGTAAFTVAILVLALAPWPQAQGTPPPTPLTLITRDGRRPVPTTMLSGQELVALDDLASLFQLTVGEDQLAGGVTVSYRGRTIVASADQPMASVNGRVVTLPSPVVRSGRRWLVPLDFITRALVPIYDQRIELRRASRLLIVGDVRVPRVTARIDAPGPPTRATIEVAPAAPITVTPEQGRLIVRIEADALDVTPAAGAGLIEQIRTGDQPNTVAVVLAPAAGAPRAVPSTAENVARVAIEVPALNAPPAETSVPARPATPPVPETPIGAPRTGFQTVVLDPGHGGDDVGVRGGGVEEKQLTLDVARRLRGLLEARLGLRVVLTREDDRAVGLDERAAVANNNKADLFLSLHANGALAPAVTGAEVVYLRLDREGEDVRAADAPVLSVLGGGRRVIDAIPWDLAQARHVEASAALAGMLDDELRRRVVMSPRAIRQVPARVLTAANMPAALVEMAYLTNAEQAKAAAGEDFRNAVAQSIYDAITRFRAYAEEQRAQ